MEPKVKYSDEKVEYGWRTILLHRYIEEKNPVLTLSSNHQKQRKFQVLF